MRTWTATTTAAAHPEAVLDVLTDPDAAGSEPAHPPVPFEVDDLDGERLLAGSRARVSGRLAGRSAGFDVEVHEADESGGSEVHASVSVRSGGGLSGRLLAQATGGRAGPIPAGALETRFPTPHQGSHPCSTSLRSR